jgi:hypothetical protein
MAYVPVAQPAAVQHPCFPQASIWLTFVRSLLFPNSHRFDSASAIQLPTRLHSGRMYFNRRLCVWAYSSVFSQILPVSSVRYRSFAHRHVSNGVLFLVDVIYLSNGLFNVLLFSVTRPFLLPHDPPTPSCSITLDNFHVTPPLQNDGLNERPNTDTLTVPRYDSPTNSNGPQSDSIGRATLRWSADGVASYINPSRESVGSWFISSTDTIVAGK